MNEMVLAIREYFAYDPDTGVVCNKSNGKKLGWVNTNGYWRVQFPLLNRQFYVHQIAFAIMEGYIPIEVDHRDTDKQNNKWGNLRDAHHELNSCNVNKRITNKSGLKGVSWAKSNNCWRMDIAYKKVKYHSYHLTKEDAYEAYCKKSAELHREFGRVG